MRGRQLLYEFCAARGIPHQRCGKLIVAPAAQVPALRTLQQRAIANGVDDLTLLDAAQVRELEPEVRCAAGLLSPSTGIVDAHELLLAMIADLEAAGGALVLRTRVESARATDQGFVVTYASDAATSEIECKWLVNSAGLSALDLLQRINGRAPGEPRRAYYAKGNYFACQGVKPFRRLVYPMPNEGGLGVHATLDLDGTTRSAPMSSGWSVPTIASIRRAHSRSTKPFASTGRRSRTARCSLPTPACAPSSSGPARQRRILRSPSHVDSSTCSASSRRV